METEFGNHQKTLAFRIFAFLIYQVSDATNNVDSGFTQFDSTGQIKSIDALGEKIELLHWEQDYLQLREKTKPIAMFGIFDEWMFS